MALLTHPLVTNPDRDRPGPSYLVSRSWTVGNKAAAYAEAPGWGARRIRRCGWITGWNPAEWG